MARYDCSLRARARAHDRGPAAFAAFNRRCKFSKRDWKAVAQAAYDETLSGVRPSRAARDCVATEISKHCHKKKGRCRDAKARKQAIAIGFSICRRKGYRSIRK